ncbi:DUF1217 domain-containing protein [Paracoccaceae bacterium Fryx2]|nr:DUF1217 domain-containing protein [Paracoccaceae bacterium Fryx2]
MSFAPVVPLGGYAGWGFLKRTMAKQQAAFAAAPALKRDEDYFRAKIGSIKTAEDLVSDRRLLKVALGAFGLDADINNRYFIKKVLADGTLDTKDLANRLADKQYAAFSSAFGFGDYATPRTQLSDFADKILSAYKTRQFEMAVGEQNGDMRLALNAERELPLLATNTATDNGRWYAIMGNTPLRKVFETALGLPSSFGSLDLDQQMTTFRARAEKMFGSSEVSQFADPKKLDSLMRQFLARSDSSAGVSLLTRGAGALQLLQNSQAGYSNMLSRLG